MSNTPPEPEIHNPGTVLIGIFLAAVLFQVGLLQWKKRHLNSYLVTSIILLWLVPVAISFLHRFWRFIIIWSIYTLLNLYSLRMTIGSKIDTSTPRFIYRFYRGIFNVTMGIAGLGYLVFLINFFIFPNSTIIDISLNLMFYGLYFGVLSRDLIDYASDKMATTIGYYSKEGFPSKHLRLNVCAICSDEVCHPSKVPSFNANNNDAISTSAPLLGDPDSESKYLFLNCHHAVHTTCLYGWCMIGKKDICPYCKEKVDLSLINTNPWKDPEFVYGKVLDFVRYMIVWQPLLLFVLHFVINFLRK